MKTEIPCLDHGYVALVNHMGDDQTPARTARTSFRFYMKMPIFVARQIIRHRTASVNEISLHYVQAVKEFYVPDRERCQKQSESNKQGSSFELVEDPEAVQAVIKEACLSSFYSYQELLDEGLSKELARTVLPLGIYTEWYFQQDLHNLLHFLKLRRDPHAQYEVRVYADAMLELIRPIYPSIIEAWEAQ